MLSVLLYNSANGASGALSSSPYPALRLSRYLLHQTGRLSNALTGTPDLPSCDLNSPSPCNTAGTPATRLARQSKAGALPGHPAGRDSSLADTFDSSHALAAVDIPSSPCPLAFACCPPSLAISICPLHLFSLGLPSVPRPRWLPEADTCQEAVRFAGWLLLHLPACAKRQGSIGQSLL